MAKRVFHFEGTNKSKFMIAGINYIRKPLRMNKTNTVLAQFIKQNYEEVCEDSAFHGFCNGQCKTCKIQGACDCALIELATKPQLINVVNHYHINNCRNVFICNEPSAKDRGVKREALE